MYDLEKAAGEAESRADVIRHTEITSPIRELIKLAEKEKLTVRFVQMYEKADGMLADDQILIKDGMTEPRTIFVLAHEIAHHFMHYDMGDITNDPLRDQYEEQADRCARAILSAMSL